MAAADQSGGQLQKVSLETDQGILVSEERKWGLPLHKVYKHALSFYKDKDGKAVHLSYEDRLKLIAYTQQANHGPFNAKSAPPVGVLDVIGRDRRTAWQAMGNISQVQALAGFVHTLDRLCPMFAPYIEAINKDTESKNQTKTRKIEDAKAHQDLQERIKLETEKKQNNDMSEDKQMQKIKDALNAQTYKQFLEYAKQQYPGNFDQQAVLIRQLQDQHYQQYIHQLAIDRRLANSSIGDHLQTPLTSHQNESTSKNDDSAIDCNSNGDDSFSATDSKSMQTSQRFEHLHITDTSEARDDESEDDGFPSMEEARMWTRGDVAHFKESARDGGGTITVGHGETVTVRVPTHGHARSLCWEFATDFYDIGFGLYFEWGKSPTAEVTVHVTESDDEDEPDGDPDEEWTGASSTDAELGESAAGREVSGAASSAAARLPVSVVVPIYRRDSHNEVYAGSHTHPGDGVYLLRFDNTYSLWRSKTLYYKVYYTH